MPAANSPKTLPVGDLTMVSACHNADCRLQAGSRTYEEVPGSIQLAKITPQFEQSQNVAIVEFCRFLKLPKLKLAGPTLQKDKEEHIILDINGKSTF